MDFFRLRLYKTNLLLVPGASYLLSILVGSSYFGFTNLSIYEFASLKFYTEMPVKGNLVVPNS